MQGLAGYTAAGDESGADDPLNDPSFEAVAYINQQFPDEVMFVADDKAASACASLDSRAPLHCTLHCRQA